MDIESTGTPRDSLAAHGPVPEVDLTTLNSPAALALALAAVEQTTGGSTLRLRIRSHRDARWLSRMLCRCGLDASTRTDPGGWFVELSRTVAERKAKENQNLQNDSTRG